MTAESKPRIKITYATLSADNEELHAGFEAAVAEAKTQLGWHYKQLHRRRMARRRRHVRGALADRSGTCWWGRSRPPPRPTSTRRWPRRGPPSRPGPRSLARAPRHRPPRGRVHQRPLDGRTPPTWRSRSERTGSRRSARSRSRPTSCATTRRRWRTTRATTTRWATSGSLASTPARSCGRTACSR